jgi:phage gp45-like
VPLRPTGSGRAKKVAEAIVLFLSGNRSHGVVIAQDDRRFRPTGLKEGEVCLYDDQKQQVVLTREGIRIKGGDGKLPLWIDVGDAQFRFTKDSISLTVGGNAFSIDADGYHFSGKDASVIEHNGHKIDRTHRHVDAGGVGLSGAPE